MVASMTRVDARDTARDEAPPRAAFPVPRGWRAPVGYPVGCMTDVTASGRALFRSTWDDLARNELSFVRSAWLHDGGGR